MAPVPEHAMTQLKADPRLGLRLAGRYLVEERIDSGGMAVVYRARDEILGRDVAVKIMHPAFAADPTFAERFAAEARNAARLSHPNIVAVYDYGESLADTGNGSWGHDLYIVMELVEGTTLRSLLERFGRLDPPTARHVARGVAAALDHAHGKGIVHRDVKPENVLLTPDGQVKVVDFGIAKALGPQAVHMTGDRPIGTVAYVAPEQISRGDIDGRADVYALGAMTYEMVTGRPPFRGDTPQAVAAGRLQDPTLHAGISPQIDAAVSRATAARAEDRFATPGEFARALGDGGPPTFLAATDHLPPPPAPAVSPPTETFSRPAPDTSVVESRDATREREHDEVLPFQMRLRHRRRRRFRIYVALATILAIAAGVTYTAMPKASAVPDVRGQSLEQARVAVRRAGLEVGTTQRVFHDAAADGTVVGTEPKPGTDLKKGTSVKLLVSKGPQLFDVPDVIGESVEEAKEELTQAGFTLVVGSEQHHDSIPQGAVISHDPARERAKRGTSFTVVVSKGPPLIAIPNVSGRTPGQAEAAIEQAGFVYGSVLQFSDTVDEGVVIGSDPPSGRMAPKGSRVAAIVSKGPRPFPMPDLTGMTLAAATEKAKSLGLVVRNEYPVPGSGKPKGQVQGQNPPAGTSVRKGAPVDVYYAN